MGTTMHFMPGAATLPTESLVQRYLPSVLEAMLQRRIDRSIERALDALGDDSVLFLPRENQLSPRLAEWSAERRIRVSQLLERQLADEFAELQGDWSEASATLTETVWPQIEGQLLGLALRGLATRWILRRLGDAVTLGELAPHDDGWRASLGVRGRAENVGWLTLDASGKVVEEQTTPRPEIVRLAHAA